MERIDESILDKLENKEILEYFWKKLDVYIANDTVIQEIDNTFPRFFFENYDIYQKLFNQVSHYYNDYYKKLINEDIDFNIEYSDAFRYIVESLKKTYKEKKNIYSSDLDNIISDMYHVKYMDHLQKNKVGEIIEILRMVKYFC